MKTANLFQGEKKLRNLNACVGENGWTGMTTYMDGYQSATLIMLESILSSYDDSSANDLPTNASYWDLDTSIYPIVFSARHFIELFLKHKIHLINHLKVKKDIDDKLTKTHDIGKLWIIFKEIVIETNELRITEFISLLDPFIQDFSKIDSTGETFRYPYSTRNDKHLKDISVIGINNFYEKFNELSEITNSFNSLIVSLKHEYRVKTFTKNMSRVQIRNLAQRLPIFEKWTDESFTQIKSDLKQEFNISANELTKVIEIIKSHIEFKRYIYPNTYDLQISETKLIQLLKNYYSRHALYGFTDEEIASVRAIIEISIPMMNGNYYSEDYSFLYEDFLKGYQLNSFEKETDADFILVNLHRLKKGLIEINYRGLLDSNGIF